jgi:hypothetical protein
MKPLKLSTASQVVHIGPFVDEVDGTTAETGLSIANTDIKLLKHGQTSSVNKNSGGATHVVNGVYHATLDGTDTNTLGRLRVSVKVAGAGPVWEDFLVLPADVYDAIVNGTGNGIRADLRTWLGSAPNALVSSRVDASVGAVANNAITAASIAADAITDAKIANGALTAAKFAAGAFDAVWAVATRLLTAGTNIVLAKGSGVTGFNDLSAAQVNAEVDTALADYDGPTKAELDVAEAAIVSAIEAALSGTARAPVTGPPAANAPLDEKIDWLYALARNKRTQGAAGQETLRNAADDGTIATRTNVDDGTTATLGLWS